MNPGPRLERPPGDDSMTPGRCTAASHKVIADVVSSAINSKNPRTRYAAGKFAKMLICLRVWLGDRIFDRIILSQTR